MALPMPTTSKTLSVMLRFVSRWPCGSGGIAEARRSIASKEAGTRRGCMASTLRRLAAGPTYTTEPTLIINALFAALAKAFAQLDDPRLQRIVLWSMGLALGLLLALGVVL